MKKYNWDKLFTLGEERAKFFKWAAVPVVECTTHADEETMRMVEYITAVDMAMGEALTKNKHIGTGIVIGTLCTLSGMTIIQLVKLKKEIDKLTDDELEELRNRKRFNKLVAKIRKNGLFTSRGC